MHSGTKLTNRVYI